MSTFAICLLSIPLAFHKQIAALLSSEWSADLVHALYWAVPKITEIGKAVIALVAPTGELPPEFQTALTWTPFLTTAAFGVVCLSLASWLFSRKDF